MWKSGPGSRDSCREGGERHRGRTQSPDMGLERLLCLQPEGDTASGGKHRQVQSGPPEICSSAFRREAQEASGTSLRVGMGAQMGRGGEGPARLGGQGIGAALAGPGLWPESGVP